MESSRTARHVCHIHDKIMHDLPPKAMCDYELSREERERARADVGLFDLIRGQFERFSSLVLNPRKPTTACSSCMAENIDGNRNPITQRAHQP